VAGDDGFEGAVHVPSELGDGAADDVERFVGDKPPCGGKVLVYELFEGALAHVPVEIADLHELRASAAWRRRL